MSSSNSITLVVDCNNLGYTAAYSTGQLSFHAHPTGVIYGFLSQILTIASRFGTKRFVFCWDSKKSYRKIIYPHYKANRRKDISSKEIENLQQMHKQFDQLRKDVLPELGFRNIYRQVGYEADDLIAHIVQRFPDNYVIVSTDNDLWQLIDYAGKNIGVVVYNQRKKSIMDYSQFVLVSGISPPSVWAEVKSIAGCSTDNVKGVKGVGELTAIKYISGKLQDGKIKDRILESSSIIDRNRELVSLPFGGKPIKIKNIQSFEVNFDGFKRVFDKYGFESFLEKKKFDRWVKTFEMGQL